MPDLGRTRSGGGDADVPAYYGVSTLGKCVLSKLDLRGDNLYLFTCCRILKSNGHLFDSSTAQGIPLPLGRKQSQLLLLVLTQTVAISETSVVNRPTLGL